MFRARWRLIGLAVGVTLACGACGGTGDSTETTPPPCNAATKTCYVKTSGNDTNSGADPANALRTIIKAGQLARNNYRVIVGPGTYVGGVTLATVGLSADGVQFVADTTGAQTVSAAGPVIVDATHTALGAGFSLSSTPGSLIHGFTITGGADAGIVIKSGKGGGSDNLTIRNCIVFNNPGDGIRIQDSANALIFNNLVYGNQGNGLVIAGQGAGSKNAHLINNTVANNGVRGLAVGNTSAASPAAFVRNNIFQNNAGDFNIKVFAPPPPSVPRSDVAYDADFNLVRPATYQPANIAGLHDISSDARLGNGACPPSVLAAACAAFHLQANSPAIGSGDSLGNLMTVDLQGNPVSLRAFLIQLTATGGSSCDQAALDLGFHFPPTGACTQ